MRSSSSNAISKECSIASNFSDVLKLVTVLSSRQHSVDGDTIDEYLTSGMASADTPNDESETELELEEEF